MAVKPLAADSKLVVYNNEVDLADKGVSQVYQGATIADVVAASGAGGATFVTEHPVTDPTKVGEKVYYNGEEWIYASTALLETLGLDSSASEGFPVPYNTIQNPLRYVSPVKEFRFQRVNAGGGAVEVSQFILYKRVADGLQPDVEFDFGWCPVPQRWASISPGGLGASAVLAFRRPTDPGTGQGYVPFTITRLWGAEYLFEIEDLATGTAFSVQQTGDFSGSLTIPCAASVLDQFMTELPATTKTATLDFTSFSGAGTCNPAIATAKGYTVLV